MKKNADPGKNKIGLREIAAEANVSVATVSRVLNGNNRVDPAIREVVLDAAAKLNVDLSQRNKTKAMAFLLSNRAMLHAFHSRILLGAEAYCAANGWDMVFLSYNYSPNVPWKELHLPKVVQRHDVVRAVVLAGANSVNLLELLDHKGIAYSVLGNNVIGESQSLKGDIVYSDDIHGGQEMTQYLLSLGHRDIWFVGNVRLPWFARHFEGYRRAMTSAGLQPRLSGLEFDDETEMGYINTKSLLAQGEPCTAILAGNDQAAHGVYKGLRDSGLKVPDDISVAGCDDTASIWLYPGLTTTREFPEQLGQQLVKMVLNRISQPSLPPQVVTIPTELIKRESCKPVAAAKELLAAEVTAS
ncbi:MAG: LacI family DNA-binding transcriptional regulator [Acidobacteriaceae bacterium]